MPEMKTADFTNSVDPEEWLKTSCFIWSYNLFFSVFNYTARMKHFEKVEDIYFLVSILAL